jgi:TatD DNase family protein
MLIDTHAHIHFDEFEDILESVFENAKSNSVDSIITVGTNEEDSLKALEFVNNQKVLKLSDGIGLYATAGIHPHDAGRGKSGYDKLKEMVSSHPQKDSIKAIGECGLDYFKDYSSKSNQFKMLELQLSLARALSLPVVFHVRDAWDDFFAILKNHPDIRGVIHSFTGHPEHVELASSHGLYFGINGIMTFTKDQEQLEALKAIPIELLLLETDCPYLAPAPFRGKPNQPGYITEIAQFVARATNNDIEHISSSTTRNAKELFGL